MYIESELKSYGKGRVAAKRQSTFSGPSNNLLYLKLHPRITLISLSVFADVSHSHDGRLAETNRDAAVTSGAVEASTKHPGAAGAINKRPTEHGKSAILAFPSSFRANERPASLLSDATTNVNSVWWKQAYQLHCQCKLINFTVNSEIVSLKF